MTIGRRKPKRKALVIAVRFYDDERLQELNICEKDGIKMRSLLSRLDYDVSDNGDLMIGRVMYSDLKDRIKEFFLYDVLPQDTLVFYFSGHGLLETSGDRYLGTSDVVADEPFDKGYSFNELLKMAHRSISRKIILILDCCYSGNLEANRNLAVEEPVDKMFSIKTKRGVCVLSSSQQYQESIAVKGKENSLFTSYILSGLQGNKTAVDGDGNVTSTSLFDYVYDNIMCIPADERNNQRPMSIIDQTTNKILASYNELAVEPSKELVSQIEDVRTEGDKYLVKGDFARARSYYNKVTTISHLEVIYHNEGLSYLGSKKFNDAIQSFDKALKLNSNYQSAWNYKGICHAELNEYEISIKCFDMALDIGTDDYGIWYNKGLALLKQGHFDLALKCFNESLDLNPVYENALGNKAVCLDQLGEHRNAIKIYKQLLRLGNRDPIVWNNLAISHSHLGDHKLALLYINLAIRMDVHDPKLIFTKGLILSKMGNEELAIVEYEKAGQLDVRFVDAYYYKGLAYGKLDKNKEALSAFSKALTFSPTDYGILYNMGVSYSKIERYQNAIKCYDKVLHLNPTFPLAWYSKGLALDNLGKIISATNCFEQAINLESENSDFWYSKGLVLARLNLIFTAISCYEQAVKISPKDPIAWYNLGLEYHQLDELKHALNCYNSALQLNPDYFNAEAVKSSALIQLKQVEEAFDSLEKCTLMMLKDTRW